MKTQHLAVSIASVSQALPSAAAPLISGSHRPIFARTFRMVAAAVLILGLFVQSAEAVPGDVLSELKISETAGGFTGGLTNFGDFGSAVAALGDLDGDGVDDFAVGNRNDDDGGVNSGAVWILFMNSDGTVGSHQKISQTSGGFGGALSTQASFGEALAPLGDLDGDGVGDLAVSAPRDDTEGPNRGAVFILLLNRDGTVKSEERIRGFYDEGRLGAGLSVIGDLDQDGTTEIAVGIPGLDDFNAGDDFGAVVIYFLLPNGTVHSAEIIYAASLGASPGDGFGASATALGDLDGDGVPDLAVGATKGSMDDGVVWVVFLNEDGSAKSTTQVLAVTPADDHEFGASIGLAGDLNGDGLPELAVGSPSDDDGGSFRGAVYLFSLTPSGTSTLVRKISDTSGGLSGSLDNGDQFGASISGIANFDGLGGGGLIVGASGDDDGGGSEGAVYLLEIEGSSLICGNGALDPVEECDDGNTSDFDGCTASCELEDQLSFFGVAGNTGLLTAEIDGVTLSTSVSSGDTPATLASLLAALINSTPALQDFGTSAQSLVGSVYANGRFASGELAADGAQVVVNPGRVLSFQKISGIEGGFSGLVDNADLFGESVASIGDLDGDGVGDIAIGAAGDDDGGQNHGAIWILFMNADGTVKSHQKISDTEGGFDGTLFSAGGFAGSVASFEDLDGDGVSDLAVGAFRDDDGGPLRGAVWILFLNTDGTVKGHQKISDGEGMFQGTLNNEDLFGASVAALGDLDGDGVEDLATGAYLDSDGGFAAGAVWVLFLNPDGTVKSHQKLSGTQGGMSGLIASNSSFGTSVASLGDFDGDGIPDLAVGAPFDDAGGGEYGAVWILLLNTDGTVKGHHKISDTDGGFSGILQSGTNFGGSLSSPGDLDGDGVADLVVGADLDDDGGFSVGAIWVLLLNADGTVKNYQKTSDTQGGFSGNLSELDLFGGSVASLGDLDGDGIAEIAVGSPFDHGGGSNRGAVYILSLDSAPPPVCGDGQVAAPETCDDGNTTPGDGCYLTCQVEDETEFNGVGQGGQIVAQIDGNVFIVPTVAGQQVSTVAGQLVDAINLDPALQSIGVSSVDLGNRVVTDGMFDYVRSEDPGITVPEPRMLSMLAMGVLGLAMFRRAGWRASVA